MAGSTTGVFSTLVLLVAGLAAAGGGVYLYQDATEATENAVEVDATVVSSEVESKLQDNDQTGQRDRVYYATIEYRYSYDGNSYTSTNLCPGVGSNCDAAQDKDQQSEARAILEEYPESETVTAYVQPDDPSEAHLVDAEESSTKRYLVLAGFGGLLGVVGVVNLLRLVTNQLGD
jgi:hypothetical protein